VLKSAQAIEMSVFVVRAFVRMREMLTEYKELAVRLEAVERNLQSHDDAIRALAQAVRQLMTPPAHDHKQIGFVRRENKKTNEK
jgi:hypothetical protein